MTSLSLSNVQDSGKIAFSSLHPMEPYSERNPVPTTQKFLSEQRARQDEALASEHEGSSQSTPSSKATSSSNDTDEKSQLMSRMAGPTIKPTDKAKQRKRGLTRTVKDPTTGTNVIIKDAEFQGTTFKTRFSDSNAYFTLRFSSG